MSRQVIIDVCKQENINVRILSRGWLFRLEKDSKVRYMFKNCLALNSQSSSAIAADKYATFEVLRAAGIPVIDHAILYPFNDHRDFAEGCNTPAYLEKYFREHDRDIVLKPNHGFGGQGITRIQSVDQFPEALAAAFAHSDSASLCPFYHIRREYRIIMLDSEARLVYAKERGSDWRFNLQNGATSTPVQDQNLYTRLVSIAERAVKELNLRFCSVDIIETMFQTASTAPDTTTLDATPELLVIEVNSAAETAHYCEQHPEETNFVREIYRDAILKMFE